jgi:1,4-alpha-glucan branching enzyme
LEIQHVHNADRVLAFHRWKGPEHYLVIGTLSDTGWPDGYRLPAPSLSGGRWREIISSDEVAYGGAGVANAEDMPVVDGHIELKLPARGFIVIRYVPNS